jgi:hypothetical protein
VLAGRGGGRSGVLRSAEWPIRATGQYRANGAPHDDACPFDGTHDNRADDVSDRLSVALTYGVAFCFAFCFAVSFALTGSIEGDAECCSTRAAKSPSKRPGGSGVEQGQERGYRALERLLARVRWSRRRGEEEQMEQEAIRARSIELVNDLGEPSLMLDGGGGDSDAGIIVYGPRGPESSVTILVRRDTGMPYIMANTEAGSAVLFTFDQDGEPEIHVRDTDGQDRTLDL